MGFDIAINNKKLAMLFRADAKSAIQLWIVQRTTNKGVQNRLVYGWIVPYTFSNNEWSSPREDRFKDVGKVHLQVICITAYLDSQALSKFIKKFEQGETLEEASKYAGISCSEDIIDRFGGLKLDANRVIKPVSYLIGGVDVQGLASPYTSAGAYSTSISSLEKQTLLFGDESLVDRAIIEYIAGVLKNEADIDIVGKDSSRLGELELLVFPMLDAYGRSKLTFSAEDNKKILALEYTLDDCEVYDDFILKIECLNDGQIIYSNVITFKVSEDRRVYCSVNIDSEIHNILDERRLEFCGRNNEAQDITVVLKSTDHYLREISMTSKMISLSGTINNPWLTKYTRLSSNDKRIQAAQSVQKSSHSMRNLIGGRKDDPWVSVNRELKNNLTAHCSLVSEGKFFPRHTEGEGRLEFVEWWKQLFSDHAGDDFIIFDPYFENVGVGLIAVHANGGSNVTIFTVESDRIEDIEKSFLQCKDIFSGSSLTVYFIPYIHDRYLLIADSGGNLKKGYTLSNSIQAANQDHPLLVTPIPKDVLVDVNLYLKDIVDSAEKSILAFSSVDYWENEKELSRQRTKKELSNTKSFDSWNAALLAMMNLSDAEFYNGFSEVGRAIAHSDRGGFFPTSDVVLGDVILGQLYRYLDQRCLIIDPGLAQGMTGLKVCSLVTKPVSSLLKTLTDVERECSRSSIKASALDWADVYAVKILWRYDAINFLGYLEKLIRMLDGDNRKSINAFILEEAISKIALSCSFLDTDMPVRLLLDSPVGLLQWIGYSYIELAIQKQGDLKVLYRFSETMEFKESVQLIGWILNRNADGEEVSDWHEALIEYLVSHVISHKLSMAEAEWLVSSMRGRMHWLGYAEPWLSMRVVSVLIESDKVEINDVSSVWMAELVSLLNNLGSGHFYLSGRDVRTTYVAAYLFSFSAQGEQTIHLEKLTRMIKAAARVIRKPLAASVDGERWDQSMNLVLWIYGFLCWTMESIVRPNTIENKFNVLIQSLEELLVYKPEKQWVLEEQNDGLWLLFFKRAPIVESK